MATQDELNAQWLAYWNNKGPRPAAGTQYLPGGITTPPVTPTPTAAPAAAAPGLAPATGGGATYTVQPGESYESIAGKVYGDQRMFAELMKANGIYVLRAGDVLDLPPAYKDPFVSNVLAGAMGMAPATAFDVTGKLKPEWWKGPTGWTNMPREVPETRLPQFGEEGLEIAPAPQGDYWVPPVPYSSEWYSAIYRGLQVPPPYGYGPIVSLGQGGGRGGYSPTGRSDYYDTLVGMTNWRLTLG